MIPICLVTGFLGSGKTTFLKDVAARHMNEKIVYLVNDFSPQDVDGVLLEEVEEDVVAIPGGSIFCRCLVTQFAGNLKTIPERFDGEEAPLKGVVIEAGGIADPKVIEALLAETGLDAVYELATIVSIVDPGSLPKLAQTLPNIKAQIEAADVVLLNKTDLFSAGQVAEAERIAREVNPRVEIIRTVRCRTELELFGGGGARGLEGDYALCADPNYARFSVAFEGPADIRGLVAGLEDLSEGIYRAKGFVPTEDGYAYLDMSAAELSVLPVATARPPAVLAIIARPEFADSVQALVGRLSRTAGSPAM